LILSGIFAGLALGSKYTAGILLPAGLAVLLWELRGSTPRATVQSLLRFAAPAVLLSLPWWVKNLLATGNPFYPFFMPAGAVNAFRLEFYQIPVWGGWPDLAFLPWRATFSGIEGGVGYSASIGPLLLGLAPLAWLGWPARPDGQRTSLRMAALASLVGIAVWAAAARLSGYLIQSRLYFSLFPAFALLSGAGFQSLEGIRLPGVRLGRVAGALVLLVFGFSAIQVGEAAIRRGSPQKLLALKDEASYLDDNLGWYSPAARAARGLPAGSQALMLWEPRSLYCEPVCLPDEVLDRWLNDLRAAGSAEKVLQRWQENGVTHLMYNRFGADFVRREDLRYKVSDWQALDDLLAQLPAPADFGGAYLLYPLTTP
jgi:4-amino-4-deoxy-L-arabinose transferase-like glycosyltransferase